MAEIVDFATRKHRPSPAPAAAAVDRDFWLASVELALMHLADQVDRGPRASVREAVADVRTAWEGLIATLREQGAFGEEDG